MSSLLKNKVLRIIFCMFQLAWGNLAMAAEVPGLIHYEGYLSNEQGIALADGNYGVKFKIYDTATGGTALWTENWSALTVTKGHFRVLLGTQSPLTSAFFQQFPSTYLGITVGTDNEMLPRQRIASVPYALSAPGSAIPAGGIIMWSGAVNTIPNGWALCDGNNGTPDLRNRFIVGSGSNYSVGATGGTATNSIQHNHSITTEAPGTNSAGDHGHHIATDLFSHVGDVTDKVTDGSSATVASESHGHHLEVDTWGAGSHSHVVNSHGHGGVTGSASGIMTLDNRPLFYALAFIMKM